MKISFIIPVYNTEVYLRKCLDSILNQSYNEIEIILVNDGSTDSSPSICDDYANKDSRVSVLHKQNGGQSDARNKGVSIATGEYIIFVDSDDFWIEEDSLKKLVDVAQMNDECDFIGFNCAYYYPKSGLYTRWVEYNKNITQQVDKDYAVQRLVESGTFPMSPCLKLISRKTIENMSLHFRTGTLAEDIPWFIDLLEGTRKCIFLNMYVYAYRQNVVGSVTNSNKDRIYSNLFNILKIELEKIENRTFNKESKNALYSFLAYEYCILLSILSKVTNTSIKRKELYKYKWLLGYTLNPKVRKVSYIYRLCGLRVTEFFLSYYYNKRVSRS